MDTVLFVRDTSHERGRWRRSARRLWTACSPRQRRRRRRVDDVVGKDRCGGEYDVLLELGASGVKQSMSLPPHEGSRGQTSATPWVRPPHDNRLLPVSCMSSVRGDRPAPSSHRAEQRAARQAQPPSGRATWLSLKPTLDGDSRLPHSAAASPRRRSTDGACDRAAHPRLQAGDDASSVAGVPRHGRSF